jgi:hypothetical protein
MEIGRHSPLARNQPTETRRDRWRQTTRGLFCGALLSGHCCAQGVEGEDERLLKIDESGAKDFDLRKWYYTLFVNPRFTLIV